MENVLGILGAVTVLVMGLLVFTKIAWRGRREIRAAGYNQVEGANQEIANLSKKLFDREPAEIYRKEDSKGESWLVIVGTGTAEDAGCVMLVNKMEEEHFPVFALIRSEWPIPKYFRRLEGGIFKQVEPLSNSDNASLANTGWFAYKGPGGDMPASLKERLFSVVQSDSFELLGVSFVGAYLAVWSDVERIKGLLDMTATIRATCQDANNQELYRCS